MIRKEFQTLRTVCCTLSLVLIALTLTAFGSSSASAKSSGNSFSFHLFSMGTLWKFDLYSSPSHPTTLANTELLVEEVNQLLSNYEMTFSDWNESSELRKLERVVGGGMAQWQEASPLFLHGLELSQQAYAMTQGYFDISVGAILWKVSPQATGVGPGQLQFDHQRFRFTTDPKRLTFGGIAKGMAVGKIAELFAKKHLTNFRINAGGGNLAVMGQRGEYTWEEEQEIGPMSPHFVYFISHSHGDNTHGVQHIYAPTSPLDKIGKIHRPLLGAKFSSLSCKSSSAEPHLWEDGSGIADAYSTAMVLNSALAIPRHCALH